MPAVSLLLQRCLAFALGLLMLVALVGVVGAQGVSGSQGAQGTRFHPDPVQRAFAFQPGAGEGAGSVVADKAFVRTESAVAGPVTILSSLRFSEEWSATQANEVWLVNMAHDRDAAAPKLGLIWTKTQVGWVQAWQMQLVDRLSAQPATTAIKTLAPQAGHTYTTRLSYDPQSGMGSLQVIDVTSGEMIHTGGFSVGADERALFAATGLPLPKEESAARTPPAGHATAGVHVSGFDVYSEYVPVASRLEVASEATPHLAFGMFDRDESIFIRLVAPGARPDAAYWLRARHHDTGEQERLGPIHVTDDETRLPPILLHLPGKTTLTLEYVADGHVWLTSATDVSIGWLNVAIGAVEFNEEADALDVEVQVQSDGEINEIPLTISAALQVTARDPRTGRFTTHAYPERTLFDRRVTAGKELSRIPTTIALPESAPFGLWEVRFRVHEPATSLDIRSFNREHFVMPPPPGLDASRSQSALATDEQELFSISLEEEARLRRAAATRERRIIFNNDGGDARAPRTSLTVERFLDTRTTALVGTQVDTIAYDTTSGTFGAFSHWTEIGEVAITREGVYQYNFTPELILRHGTDPLQVMVDFAREHDLEIFWAMRMNDIHDAGNPLLMSQLKREHPEWLFGSPEHRPPHGLWSGIDYGRSEVRELAFRYIEEVADNYDVDGVLLDFFRHPALFKRVAWGEIAGEEELNALTELLGRVRERTREIGARRGKPILIAVRVPDSVAFNRAIGIDLEEWLVDGLIDLLIPTGYFRLSEWEESVELGRRYGVPVYPSLDESRVSDAHSIQPGRTAIQSYRARAMNLWQAGAAGIHLFNMFRPTHPMLHEIGSPESLVGTDKAYYASFRGNTGYGSSRRWVSASAEYNVVPVLTPDSPMKLEEGAPLLINLPVGEDVEASVAAGFTPRITLRLVASDDVAAEDVSVRLNGHPLASAEQASALEYPVGREWLRRGDNRLEVSLADASSPVGKSPSHSLYDVQLQVEYAR